MEELIHAINTDDSDRPTTLIASDYRILAYNQAFDRQASTPVTAGESRCYKVSHQFDSPCHENGEACPLLRAQQTGLAQRVLHAHHTPQGPEYCDITMEPIFDTKGQVLGYRETLLPVKHASSQPKLNQLCGQSVAFQEMLALINRVAPTDVSVLLQGESGTGKELAAEAIHNASQRCKQPFVVLECTGLNESLFESELFGYAKGAFTGATRDKPGLADAANGGTLFLDEVGDIPLQLQVKLLRLLETGTYRPVGSVEVRRANFRLISASHKNLAALVNAEEFRQDLYFRLAAFPIHLPALRARSEDISLLSNVFLQQLKPLKTLTPGALQQLQRYAFPGNIRELRNILQRAYLMTDGKYIDRQHLPALTPLTTPPLHAAAPSIMTLKKVEQQYIQQVSQHFQGNSTELAQLLGISERTLYRKLSDLHKQS